MTILSKIKKTFSKKTAPKISEERLPMQVEPRQEPVRNVLDIFCPYCASQNFVKRGIRRKKREVVQLYFCQGCQRTFTPGSVKGKHYPMAVILDAISLYNLGYSLERACEIINKNSKIKMQNNNVKFKNIDSLQASSLANWIKQYQSLCAYHRMREFGMKLYKPEDVIVSLTLAHRQLYRFRYHRAKTRLIIEEDFRHKRFWALKEFFDLVPAECPHQYFSQGLRASEAPIKFSKKEMIVRSKENYANKLAKFVLESVKESKQRHDALQRFMLANDSVTVATEVPVYIRREDLAHMASQLGFELYKIQNSIPHQVRDKNQSRQGGTKLKNNNTKKEIQEEKIFELLKTEDLPKLITGHIDFVQIRNGSIHLLDYKSHAAKEQPIEQLTLYALALSRLTGIRLFDFKCAWFDEKEYFEFFPLHVVYKKKKGRRKKVATKEGVYEINQRTDKIESLRPAAV